MLSLARRGAVTVAVLLAALIASALAPLVANVIAPTAVDPRPNAAASEATPIFGVAAVTATVAAGVTTALVEADQASPSKRADLHDAMRKLWSDHVLWTRQYIISVVAGLPDKDAVTLRLLQNQTDIGGAIARFYGSESGGKLTGLLKAHILTAGELIAAAKSGNAAKVDSVDAKWRANADELAEFLHHVNDKHWSAAKLRAALYMHLAQTRAEVEHRLKKDYVADIQDFDAISQHILGVADMLSDGIVAQFPAQFGLAKKGS